MARRTRLEVIADAIRPLKLSSAEQIAVAVVSSLKQAGYHIVRPGDDGIVGIPRGHARPRPVMTNAIAGAPQRGVFATE